MQRLLAAVAALFCLAGCGLPGGLADSLPFADQGAVVKEALANFDNASALRFSNLSLPLGEGPVQGNLLYERGSQVMGDLTQGSTPVQYLELGGQAYVKAGKAYWQGRHVDALSKVGDGRWAVDPNSRLKDQVQSLLLGPNAFAPQFRASKADVKKGLQTSVNGRSAHRYTVTAGGVLAISDDRPRQIIHADYYAAGLVQTDVSYQPKIPVQNKPDRILDVNDAATLPAQYSVVRPDDSVKCAQPCFVAYIVSNGNGAPEGTSTLTVGASDESDTLDLGSCSVNLPPVGNLQQRSVGCNLSDSPPFASYERSHPDGFRFQTRPKIHNAIWDD